MDDLTETALPPDAHAVVMRMREVGCALDVVRLRVAPGTGDGEPLHRRAAIRGVDVFTTWRARVAAATEPADPAALTGCPVSGRELLGRAVDPATGRLRGHADVFVACSSPFRRSREVREEPPRILAGPYVDRATRQRVWWVEDPAGVPIGLSDVFHTAPLGFRGIDRPGLDALFAGFLTRVLRVGAGPTDARLWDGDWSPYFDEGREWWGAYAWTVRTDRDHVVVVGASATD